MREGATTAQASRMDVEQSVAIRGERGSYNGVARDGERGLECSNPG